MLRRALDISASQSFIGLAAQPLRSARHNFHAGEPSYLIGERESRARERCSRSNFHAAQLFEPTTHFALGFHLHHVRRRYLSEGIDDGTSCKIRSGHNFNLISGVCICNGRLQGAVEYALEVSVSAQCGGINTDAELSAASVHVTLSLLIGSSLQSESTSTSFD